MVFRCCFTFALPEKHLQSKVWVCSTTQDFIALLEIFLLFIQGSGHFPYPGFVGKNDRVTDKVNDVIVSACLVYHGVVGNLKHTNTEQSFQESDRIRSKIMLHSQCQGFALWLYQWPKLVRKLASGGIFLCGIIREFMLKRFYWLASHVKQAYSSHCFLCKHTWHVFIESFYFLPGNAMYISCLIFVTQKFLF